MLWYKAFHIVGVVAWFAGLFYLPRLYVYHAEATDAISIARFKIMERRLFAIMTIGALFALICGILMVAKSPAYLSMGWLKVKFVFVLGVIAYHVSCHRLMQSFSADRNTHSSKWYRAFNEIPSVLLLAIVVLAVVKPF